MQRFGVADLSVALLAAANAREAGECLLLLGCRHQLGPYRNKWGQTALFAVSQGISHVCATLVAAGADVHAADNNGNTALHQMAWSGNEDACKLLLDADANVEARNAGGMTSLHFTAMNGQLAVCHLLIARGADVCSVDGCKRTPLICGADNLCVCALLLDEGA